MSRLPQPSSSTNSRTRLKSTPTVPSSSLRAPVTPLAKPRARTPVSTAPSSPIAGEKPRAKTPTATPSPGLRSQPSLKSLRVKSPTKSPARKVQPLPDEDVPPLPKPQLSIREQIALRRAEAKKVVKTSPVRADFGALEDASPLAHKQPAQQDVDLGRWSIKEAIERARSSGAINLSSRDLPCIPSALFEIHLGITPEPLKSVPVEPPITTSTSVDTGATRRRGNADAPSWYDAQDLEVLKAWSNEIIELQPEISMFGSLKTVDLHNNKLASLPDAFADLTALTSVDLSHNKLSSLPVNFWALPHLTSLNLSHNQLTALPFSSPFGNGSNPLSRTKDPRGDWFAQSITRATEPLARLTSLDVSHNQLSAASIDYSGLPTLLHKFDLSGNPLGKCDTLLQALGRLQRLREVHMVKADVGDDSFPVSIFSTTSGSLFPMLKILDMEETQVSRPAIEAVFTPHAVKQTIEYETTTQEPPDGTLRIIVGKRVIKEAWEIAAERRTKQRRHAAFTDSIDSTTSSVSKTEVLTEPWEIEAEQGLLSDGAKRRARAAAAAASQTTSSASQAKERPPPLSSQPMKKVVEKEAWEIEAEQGLLSAGVRRRARAVALAASSDPAKSADISRPPSPSSASRAHTPPTVGAALANPQFYDAPARTLTMPPSAPPSKASHARSFSLAAPAWSKGGTGTATAAISELALTIPAQTLPLAAIAQQPLAHTLKVLVLTSRRADPSFTIPLTSTLCLPYLEELVLENCNLADTVPVAHVGEGADEYAAPRGSEPLLPLLARLFPSVRKLNLSYNNLTSAALTKDALTALLFADVPGPGPEQEQEQGEGTMEAAATGRKGLRQLHLRGNRLVELDGFQQLAERFRGNRDVLEWKLEELDLRDNEIGRLPAELGLLPLDVLLVDGNTFRVPARRVWEREGTKGLLSWLRGRIE
ncbi:hypothetical protein C8Q80DRAFT_1352809 [Daedaleopsis nitida]|nr:hypothetical protein C8Q80DRAFT_1352809 [Daedaleopsis nitida]